MNNARKSEDIKELATALAKAQGEIHNAKKDSKNPFFKSNYADLASVWDTIRPVLSKHGLSVVQSTEADEKGLYLVTLLLHSSGQWLSGSMPINPVKTDPQGYGSAISYFRRYSLMAMVGVAAEDDDGNDASSSRRAIVPEQPGIDDGVPKEAGYRIPFGKYVKRSLDEIGLDDLRGYVGYLEQRAEKENKPITGVVAEFITLASQHIATFENQ